MKKKQVEFPDEVVLGVGYPWAIGIDKYEQVSLCKAPKGLQFESLAFPKELWHDSIPKYELILRRVK